MFNTVKSTLTTLSALALGCVLAGVAVKPADASTQCTGDEYYVSCTHSEFDYESGQYVTCYGSGMPGYITWTCNSF